MIPFLSQCPCSGGGGSGSGINQIAVLILFALVVGLWHAVKWAKKGWNASERAYMNKTVKIILIVALIGAIGLIAATQLIVPSGPVNQATTAPAAAPSSGLPKLLDLGSKSCIPCKMMAPVLEELKNDYAGRFDVEFIDVWVKENAVKAREFDINVIPTQIFFDEAGKELWRHEGFLGREEILARWKDLGYDFVDAEPSETERLKPQGMVESGEALE
jgi:thioredoxin 1